VIRTLQLWHAPAFQNKADALLGMHLYFKKRQMHYWACTCYPRRGGCTAGHAPAYADEVDAMLGKRGMGDEQETSLQVKTGVQCAWGVGSLVLTEARVPLRLCLPACGL